MKLIKENFNLIPTTPGIYKFINIINNKIYIGSSYNLRKRLLQHLNLLKNNKHHSLHFQNAWNKYSIDNFEYEIIELVEDVMLLLDREQYYLDTLLFAQDYINKINNKFVELGYNINPTSKNRLGSKQPLESIYKGVISNNRVYPVLQYDFNGKFINKYISTGEAARANNIYRSTVYNCCTNKTEYTKYGYFFFFEKDYDEWKDYLETLKESPFIPTVWNKNISVRPKINDKLIVFDRYGRFINTFQYQTDIAKFINCTTSNLCNCKNKKIIKNYYVFDLSFDYKQVIEKIRTEYEFLSNLNKEYDRILVFDVFENFICGFDSVETCSEILNLKSNSIYCVLCGKRKQLKGFIFRYNDDIV